MDDGSSQDPGAVILKYSLADGEWGAFEEREAAFDLEEEIEKLLELHGDMEYDGHELGDGWCTYYVYGPDAASISAMLLPFLRSKKLPPGSLLIERSGPPGASQRTIKLA